MLPPPQLTPVAPTLLAATPTRLPATAAPATASPLKTITSAAPTARSTALPTHLASTSTQSSAGGVGILLTSGSLKVRIEAPADGTTLKTSPVEVKGKAPEGTVISVENIVVLAKADSTFSALVKLEQGPNLIEFLASDAAGNQVFYALAIYYDP